MKIDQLEKLDDDSPERVHFLEDIYLLIKPWENPDFEDEMSKRLRASGREPRELSDAELIDVNARVMAKTILVGWEGMEDEAPSAPTGVEGAPPILVQVEYSVGKAYECLSKFRRLYKFVLKTARRIDEQRGRLEEDQTGNL